MYIIIDCLVLVESLKEYLKEVRKAIRSIRLSSVLSNKLKDKQIMGKMKYSKLIFDCPTRWGSTYNMYNRAFQHREIINSIVLEEIKSKNIYELTMLTDKHWSIVFILLTFLKPFFEANKELEARKIATINMSICIYTQLFNDGENFLEQDLPEEIIDIFKPGVQKLLEKLTFSFNQGTLVHFMGMILDIRIKCSIYNKKMWNEDLEYMLGE